ncbi:aminotransferase class I/II-fold pyridoxal phosphate-dependent enzyme [Halostagnicola kamekurae]|uniref:8-amino-7-oxononanoate synthase n=1 Tax=Halostagnicola kamekurae TaxID=619731 RepID=A0A1I6QDW1_9EURY|nr:8-amino-7-oxononanoate synthase [Halostagnicola kamekurae]SFS50478.1 8-amino-7-oxononanoate synthase [Halostagnicola kamekurae]
MVDRGFALESRLHQREANDLKRTLSPVDSVSERGYFAETSGGDLPVLESEEALVFASNNYLGLTDDQRVQDAARQAAATVGTGSAASRLVTGDTLVHHDLERLLAETKRTDRALTFSSGYAANVGTITALDPDVIFSDELNHASIVDAVRLTDAEVVIYDHCDADDLRAKMTERAEPAEPNGSDDPADESWLVVTDSVFSMDGTVAPLEAICRAAEEVGAWVMVDEAHATGLYADGGGIVQSESLEDRVHVQMGTLSKALASQGGYVAGSDALIELLINEARPFVYSTGLSPPAAASASEALHIARYGDVRERLWENVAHLRDGLEALDLEVLGESQVLPVIIGDRRDALDLAAGLRERGIVAPAIRPPTVPEGTSRIRIAPSASHDEADIVDCLESFQIVGEKVGLL